MKKRNTLTLILLFAALTLAAQNNYSPCYTNNMSKGNTAFSQGKYSEARTYYVNAKQCAGGNPSAAQQKINACDAKIKAQREAAEAKRRAEAEAAEAKRKAEEEVAEKRRLDEIEAAKAKRKAEEAKNKEEEKELELQKLKAACPTTLRDFDGNVYRTVFIGKQCWMAENLRTEHYANGTSIPIGGGTSNTTAYRYYPDNKKSNVGTYGYLYNWAAVMHGFQSSRRTPSGVQGVCPNGWHVPSSVEWSQLINYVSSQSQYQCGGSSENNIKALSSTTHWVYCSWSRKTCTAGDNPSSNNATGFSALPAGLYSGYNKFHSIGEHAGFWTSVGDDDFATRFNFNNFNSTVSTDSYWKYFGLSVRCIRD